MLGTTLNFPGYSIQSQIYVGSRTVVYKGIRVTDEMPVVIKLMQNEYPSFSEIIQFRNQYSIAKLLNILLWEENFWRMIVGKTIII